MRLDIENVLNTSQKCISVFFEDLKKKMLIHVHVFMVTGTELPHEINVIIIWKTCTCTSSIYKYGIVFMRLWQGWVCKSFIYLLQTLADPQRWTQHLMLDSRDEEVSQTYLPLASLFLIQQDYLEGWIS